jgi:quercetin dioxygenase-like cupin family protein
MLSISVYDDVIFQEKNAYAEPLFVDKSGRVLRFALQPRQSIAEHNAPHSPLYILITQGSGLFAGGDKIPKRFGRGMLLAFDMGEQHAILAEDEELVFLAFMHGVPEELKGISP